MTLSTNCQDLIQQCQELGYTVTKGYGAKGYDKTWDKDGKQPVENDLEPYLEVSDGSKGFYIVEDVDRSGHEYEIFYWYDKSNPELTRADYLVGNGPPSFMVDVSLIKLKRLLGIIG